MALFDPTSGRKSYRSARVFLTREIIGDWQSVLEKAAYGIPLSVTEQNRLADIAKVLDARTIKCEQEDDDRIGFGR